MKKILRAVRKTVSVPGLALSWLIFLTSPFAGAEVYSRYYGHAAAHDHHGVIAPWYRGLNGQCDFRVRIAAETLKRYPWTTRTNAIAEYPAYVFSGFWQISSNGVITPRDPGDWGYGDLSQRATSLLNGLVDYYRYTGDATAIAHLTYMADLIVDHGQTPSDHSWPGLFVSVPTRGKAFFKTDPHGMIQLDLCASTGQGLLRAYQVTGNRRWFETAKHWGDLLAERCNLDSNTDPWPRYANREDVKWKDNKQTGGVTLILGFLDELLRLGHTGRNGCLLAARDTARRYLSDQLLPAWLADETWGRYFWDWPNPTQNCLTTPDAVTYLLNHPVEFPNWRNDARNILTLFLNHTSASPGSGGDVYSGAWGLTRNPPVDAAAPPGTRRSMSPPRSPETGVRVEKMMYDTTAGFVVSHEICNNFRTDLLSRRHLFCNCGRFQHLIPHISPDFDRIPGISPPLSGIVPAPLPSASRISPAPFSAETRQLSVPSDI